MGSGMGSFPYSPSMLEGGSIGDAAFWQAVWELELGRAAAALADGADPNFKERSEGMTVAMKMAEISRDLMFITGDNARRVLAMMEFLAGACDCRLSDKRGRTALMHAAMRGHHEFIGMLVPVSDPLSANKNGRTALMYAAARGSFESVEALAGVSDLGATTMFGETAIDLARAAGHADMAAHLSGMWLDSGVASPAPASRAVSC